MGQSQFELPLLMIHIKSKLLVAIFDPNFPEKAGYDKDHIEICANVERIMTRQEQKADELSFFHEVNRILDIGWEIDECRESPDFIVNQGTQKFGLEVCDISNDPRIISDEQPMAGSGKKRGSGMRRNESETNRTINSLRQKYEEKNNTPLSVKFLGDLCKENTDQVLSVLEAMELSGKPIGYRMIINVDGESGNLRVYVTRACQPHWISVDDRVGWVNCNGIDLVDKTVKTKSKKLQKYRELSGCNDIRLLIVANRIMNSGKIDLQVLPTLNTYGFSVVYFLSHPEAVTIFDVAGNTSRIPNPGV